MSLNQVTNAFDLLGQAEKPRGPLRLPVGHWGIQPKLEVGWGSFRQSFVSSVRATLGGPAAPKRLQSGGFFRDCWVELRSPRRALLAASLWHLAFLVMPFPRFPAARKNPAFENVELTWPGPFMDLPVMVISGAKGKPSPRSEPEKPQPPEGADAFHPRQRIFTDPVHPTHPRQTLINSAAPATPPKILPTLPNLVELQHRSVPARPRLQISEETLAKLRPREHQIAAVTSAPLPDVANFEQQPAEITLAAPLNGPTRPRLELKVGVAPRLAQRAQTVEAEPPPDVGAVQGGAASRNPATLVALSAAPAPPRPIAEPPQGNLTARVSISPEDERAGIPGGSANRVPDTNAKAGGDPDSAGGARGKDGLGISITGGDPPANNRVYGPGYDAQKTSPPTPHPLFTRPDPHTQISDPAERSGPPNFAALPPSAQPEQVFVSKKIYKLLVNMPNLNSASGSWILNFSELLLNSDAPHLAWAELSGPVPLKKIDPKYPPTLIDERIEGEVVLYAVIRRDGSVDSIQLVRGLDEKLDANAMEALSQWKFRPATRQGSPVELEAIVHIPFHAPTREP
jgi:TonB family protein